MPTRRVALGEDRLSFDPPPGHGAMLLAAIIAFYGTNLTSESRTDLAELSRQLETNRRVAQPRLRYRLQRDRVGLTSTTHQLLRTPTGEITVAFDPKARSEPQVLAAMYRAAQAPDSVRTELFALLRSAMRWRSGVHTDQIDLADMLAFLRGEAPLGKASDWFATATQRRDWALEVMEMDTYDGNGASLARQFRKQMRRAHPDHGGDEIDAGSRVTALIAARRILQSAPASPASQDGSQR